MTSTGFWMTHYLIPPLWPRTWKSAFPLRGHNVHVASGHGNTEWLVPKKCDVVACKQEPVRRFSG